MTRNGEDGGSRRSRPSGGFTIAERKRGASDIERRTSWLAWHLFPWTGQGPTGTWPREVAYRPADEIIAAALTNRAPGVYSVRLEYTTGLNPAVGGVVQITPQLLATTLAAIQAARRYPRELPRRVGDLAAWRSAAEQRISQVSQIVDGRVPARVEPAASLPANCRGKGVESALEEYVRASGKTAADMRPLLTPLVQAFEQLEAGGFHTPRGELRYGAWRASLAGLIGRACAFCSPELVVRQAIAWIAACRDLADCRSVEEVYVMLSISLSDWLGATSWKRPDLERMLEAIPGPGHVQGDLDSPRWLDQWRSFVREYGAVGSLGSLDSAQVRRLVRHDLLATAARLAKEKPKRLQWLAAVEDEWLERSAQASRRDVWESLFSLGNDRMVRLLLKRLRAVEGADETSRTGALALLDDLLAGMRFYSRQTPAENEALLQGNFWLYDELARVYSDPRVFLDLVGQVLELVRLRAGLTTGAGLQSMVRRFLDAPFDNGLSFAQAELCSKLAEADHEKFLRVLEAYSLPDDAYPAEASDGWAHLHTHPAVRQFLIQCADQSELVPRLGRLLRRLALAVRLQLQDEIGPTLDTWTNPPPTIPPGLPPLPVPVSKQIATLAAYRILADEPEPLPASIRDILRAPERRREELEALRRMRDAGDLPDAARPRLQHLEKEASAGPIAVPIEKLEKACDRETAPVKLRALEAAVGNVINLHWRRIGLRHDKDLAAPEWDNALQLYISLRQNRRSMRNLLREEARGSREWIQGRPANVAFVESMRAAGLEMDCWLAGIRTFSTVDGAAWELYTETDPVRVLQMGSLFSTCLGAGGMNSFAAVANAIEVNKRVLYLKRDSGAIVGRRLIGLGRPIPETAGKAILVAYRSYGSTEAGGWSPGLRSSPWVKILFDLHCARLARDVGAEVSSDSAVLEAASNTLPLFLKWYDDGPEPLDWWVTSPSTRLFAVEGQREEVARLLHTQLEETGLEADSSQMWAFLRALLWLGDAAIPLLEFPGIPLSVDDLRFLERWSQASVLRAWLAERIGNVTAG